MFFIVTYTTVHAQYKYRVEYDIDFPKYSINKTHYKMVLANGPNTTSSEFVFSHFVTNVPLQPGDSNVINKKANFILETSVPYNGMNFTARLVNTGTSHTTSHEFGCYQNDIDLIIYDVIIVNYLKVYPALLIDANNYNSGTNNLLECETETINISSTTCNDTSYGVEYQAGSSTTWNTFLPYANRTSSFDIQKSNFTGLDINEVLRLRILHDTTTPSYSDIITYYYIQCSPKVASYSVQNTSCSSSSDGSFTLNFDRTITNGETLAMVLRRDNPVTGPIISSLTGVTYSGINYNWPNALAVGNYYLKYQTEPTSSLENVGPITITTPSPVLFTATFSGIDCFGVNTGSISINASGGAGNYEYSINNGSNWAAFSNATTHTISNLTIGNYQVKVRDANNCVSQL